MSTGLDPKYSRSNSRCRVGGGSCTAPVGTVDVGNEGNVAQEVGEGSVVAWPAEDPTRVESEAGEVSFGERGGVPFGEAGEASREGRWDVGEGGPEFKGDLEAFFEGDKEGDGVMKGESGAEPLEVDSSRFSDEEVVDSRGERAGGVWGDGEVKDESVVVLIFEPVDVTVQSVMVSGEVGTTIGVK